MIFNNIKIHDNILMCQVCNSTEFYKDIVEDRVATQGFCYDDYIFDEIIRYICKECGWITYFKNDGKFNI